MNKLTESLTENGVCLEGTMGYVHLALPFHETKKPPDKIDPLQAPVLHMPLLLNRPGRLT